MYLKSILILLAFLVSITSCSTKKVNLQSPSKNIELQFFISHSGEANYKINFNGFEVILPSKLGFEFVDEQPLEKHLKITSFEKSTFNEKWEMQWGEQRLVINHYNELNVKLQETKGPFRKLNIVFRLFDDGVGFRYEFPEQENFKQALIKEENTEFRLAGNYTCWWQPGDWDIYEHLYRTTKFNEINALQYCNHPNLAQTYIPVNAVNTPITMKSDKGFYCSFHEAALVDYSDMTLMVDTANLSMKSNLVGGRKEYKVKRKLPFSTPWRTIQLSENAGGLIESKMILNLNAANKLGDVSWFHPTKYMGIWWEMHLGKSGWDMAGGKHGATTENALQFIDFASENNIGALLVEGWNTGWEHWIGFDDREGVFDFVTPYPDYDLEKVVKYGKSKAVEIIMHHETSAAPRTYEKQLDSAFMQMQQLGLHMVKTGYVGKIIPKGEYHHGQWMVNHYQKVYETAAKYHIAVNAHEPIKATGLRRTYPNIISREGLRGQEFNAWASDGGNPPEHLSIIAFTRMLAGPIDYTPGIFNIKLNPYKENNQVNTTLAQQLALYVVIYSPVQMAADLIENYKNHPAFQFIRDVAVDWDETHVINGEIGDYVTITRKQRNSENWFLGSITDENARDFEIQLSFLWPGQQYKATIYADGKNAHWDTNPTAYKIDDIVVTSIDILKLHLAPGGGAAVSFFPVIK